MTVRRARIACLAAALVAAPAAFAQSLDLPVPYGNEAGCRVIRGEAAQSEEALVLRSDRFESAASICEFVQVLTSRSGAKVITALCDIEGEEGKSVNQFSIMPGATDPSALAIRDEYGAPWEEVKPCR